MQNIEVSLSSLNFFAYFDFLDILTCLQSRAI